MFADTVQCYYGFKNSACLAYVFLPEFTIWNGEIRQLSQFTASMLPGFVNFLITFIRLNTCNAIGRFNWQINYAG